MSTPFLYYHRLARRSYKRSFFLPYYPQVNSRRVGSGCRVFTPVPRTCWAPSQSVLVPGASVGNYIRRGPVQIRANVLHRRMGRGSGSTGTCVPSKPAIIHTKNRESGDPPPRHINHTLDPLHPCLLHRPGKLSCAERHRWHLQCDECPFQDRCVIILIVRCDWQWNGGWPVHLTSQSPRIEIDSPALDTDEPLIQNSRGRTYMAAVSPWFFTV